MPKFMLKKHSNGKPLKKLNRKLATAPVDYFEKRGSGGWRLQTQLLNTKYTEIWYDLKIGGSVLTFATMTDAQAAHLKLRDVITKVNWRAIEITDILPF